jgi:hypothetical protein
MGSVCVSTVSETLDFSIGVPAASLASFYLVQELALVGYVLWSGVRISAWYALLFAGLGMFLVLRLASLCLWMTVLDDVAVGVLNRLAWLCGGLVLIVLLVSWMDAVHSQFPHGTARFRFWMKVGMAGFAFAYVAALLVPTIVYFTVRVVGSLPAMGSSARMAFDASLWLHMSVCFLLSLTFLGYGIAIVVLLRRHVPGEFRESAKTLIVAVAIVMSYAIPLATFLIRPLGGCLPVGVFWGCAYIVPCLLTSTVVLFLIVEYARHEVLAKERTQQLSSQAPLLETPAMYENI